ncbi:terminase small subunit [Acetobacterium wieringae]|uniref:Terminase small subunit n=1 Tax=Acetobacterium wieringae TaxID=52694 RepID=A0ABY6HBD6_9FIRM|nr:terminase small subunit [Acetobacterium wieringae]UYO61823.1 terminase small subunit [Acetobacterium wieringae]
MTEKQKRFADEYLIDLNATRAYKAAYPNVKKDSVAAQAASRMLRNVKVKSYIDERMEEIKTDKTANAQEVLEYLTAVMRNEITEEVVVVESIGDFQTKAKTIEKDCSVKDRNKAAELLGKRYRLFVDKVESDVNQVVIFEGENELED